VVSLGIFSVVPPTEPCALRLTQPLKVSTRDFFWGKGGRCVWLTTYHPFSAETSRKSGALNYPEPLGPHRPVAGDLYFFLYARRETRPSATLPATNPTWNDLSSNPDLGGEKPQPWHGPWTQFQIQMATQRSDYRIGPPPHLKRKHKLSFVRAALDFWARIQGYS